MAKYTPLRQYLTKQSPDSLRLEFDDIEQLGIDLPTSARTHDAWWLDRSLGTRHVQARAWLNDGRFVTRVDRRAEKVWFSGRSM
jgi:hypothetical protein